MLDPVVLTGAAVRLEPLTMQHVDALATVGLDQRIWRWSLRRIKDRADVAAYVRSALAAQSRGDELPFATVAMGDDTVVGSTRYGNIDMDNRRVEIGWTWLAPKWQRTGINREAKYLLLTHAFETLGCVRVEFKTDFRNAQSRKALEGIGATEEGVLRKHMRLETGGFRDSIFYSILDDEWPGVKEQLEAKMK